MSDPGYRPKLIEVALPSAAINREAAREKSIRRGHPSTLHLWWARWPLAAARAEVSNSARGAALCVVERMTLDKDEARALWETAIRLAHANGASLWDIAAAACVSPRRLQTSAGPESPARPTRAA